MVDRRHYWQYSGIQSAVAGVWRAGPSGRGPGPGAPPAPPRPPLTPRAGRGRLLPPLQVPVWWTLVWVPFGFFMTGLQYLLTAVKNMIEPDIYLSTSVLEGYDDNEREV